MSLGEHRRRGQNVLRSALAGLHAMKLDRLAYRLWRYGPLGWGRLAGHHAFDRRHGVETRGYGDLRYEPTPAPVLERTLKELSQLGLDLVG